MLAIVTETAEAHRLQKMRDLIIFEKLATWRIMNGFDRGTDDEDNLSRSPPPTPEEYAADLRAELNTLKMQFRCRDRRSAILSTQLNRVK